ncbi:hypothetical protein [Tunturiibacter gelidiferens]|uniref:hypothetical protein n=1 Tax=Tunturiibacter gelidiferens TaxID=3069689 RepID=UPI003D9B8A42
MTDRERFHKQAENHFKSYEFMIAVANQLEENLKSWGLEEGDPRRDNTLIDLHRASAAEHLALSKEFKKKLGSAS